MSPGELRQWLRDVDVTQVEFGRLLGHGERTAQYWTGKAVPGSVATLVRLLQRRPELLDVVREIAEARKG